MGSEADASYNHDIEGIMLETSLLLLQTDCIAGCLLKKNNPGV